MENNHDIDKKFNEASYSKEEPATFPGFDKVWTKVEEKLDKKEKKKDTPFWLPYGIAASLIIGLGVFYFINKNNVSEIEKPAIAKNKILPDPQIETIDSTVKSNIKKEINGLEEHQNQKILAYEDAKNSNIDLQKSLKFDSKPITKYSLEINKPEIISKVFDTISKEKSIEEVVVTGYGISRKVSAETATSSISAPLIASTSKSTLSSLEGRVAGISVNSGSGISESSKIKIRGFSSISGSSQPLFVVNGVVQNPNVLKKLDPDKIVSIEVLKDHFATSLYGNRAANGVILVKTKKLTRKERKALEKMPLTETSETKEELPKAGQLTAGEANDFSKWNYWNDIAVPTLERYKNEWKFFPERRVSVQLVNKNKKPVVGEKIKLINDKNEIIWEAFSDNLGNAELWIDPIIGSVSDSEKYFLTDDSGKIISNQVKEFKNGQNLIVLEKNCLTKRTLDLAFVVDATGSMGDEISYLQSELLDVLKKVENSLKNTEVRYGSVFYRDFSDEYVTRKLDFTNNANELLDFIKKQNAAGGGDYPEAVVEAMEVSVDELKWSNENSAKIMFLILDAPPHHSEENINKLFEKVKEAAKKGITIIPLAASDIDKQTEYLMRTFALMTNGTYTFLTNHSGIGNSHIEPSVESYEVEKLNDLLLRLILQRATLPECSRNISNDHINKKMETEVKNLNNPTIKIFPNPTKGPINIVSEKPIDELFVYDLAGKIIMKKEKLSGKNIIDISAYPQSVYLVRARTEKGWETFKVIKN